MHILELASPLAITDSFKLTTEPHLVEDLSGAQMLVMADGGKMNQLHPEELAVRRKFDVNEDWNGKSILVMRAGGYGDLLLLSPVLREVKRRWPHCTIAVCAIPHFLAVLEHLPFVDERINYPIPTAIADQFHAWVLLENVIEKNEDAKTMHMTDVFAGNFGITSDEKYDRQPAYVVTTDEATWAKMAYPRKKGMQRLCVQMEAQAPNRSYPAQRMTQVCEHFLKTGRWEVFLLGEPGKFKVDEIPNLICLPQHNTTFRQSCAVVATSDSVLGPDSAMVHVAGALSVPAIGLYGPFPADIRVAYSPSVQVIEGKGHCAPCFHHVRRGQFFPAHGPCVAKKFCTVLDGIPVKKVIDRVTLTAKRLAFE